MGLPMTPRIMQLIKDGNARWTGKPVKIPRSGFKLTNVKPVARPAAPPDKPGPGTEASVTVPIPPSANNLFFNLTPKRGKRRGGRVPSKEYTAWKKIADPLVARLKPPASFPCKFFYLLTGKVNQARDGDNCSKPLLDATVRAGVIPDDKLKFVRGGCWHYEPAAGEPVAIIWFEEWE